MHYFLVYFFFLLFLQSESTYLVRCDWRNGYKLLHQNSVLSCICKEARSGSKLVNLTKFHSACRVESVRHVPATYNLPSLQSCLHFSVNLLGLPICRYESGEKWPWRRAPIGLDTWLEGDPRARNYRASSCLGFRKSPNLSTEK